VSAPFKVGDLVRLKNPWGPVMTVSGVDSDAVRCLWFDSRSRFQFQAFPPAVLELVGRAELAGPA
jgi:uncharacterized protein YodC (DUF2158 family)